jgi:hypothetical protein
MKSTLQFISVCLFAAILLSCGKNEADSSNVDAQTIIHAKRYAQLSGDTPLREARIEGDELHVLITASGCAGTTWTARLIDSGKVAESHPVQRYAKIEFVNNEDCLAVISRTFVFDLKPLQVEGTRTVKIHLKEWSQILSYTY